MSTPTTTPKVLPFLTPFPAESDIDKYLGTSCICDNQPCSHMDYLKTSGLLFACVSPVVSLGTARHLQPTIQCILQLVVAVTSALTAAFVQSGDPILPLFMFVMWIVAWEELGLFTTIAGISATLASNHTPVILVVVAVFLYEGLFYIVLHSARPDSDDYYTLLHNIFRTTVIGSPVTAVAYGLKLFAAAFEPSFA